MKLIDDANHVTTVPETEQWTIRGWPKKEAMDIDSSMSKPSTSSDLMKLIDDANRVTTVPEAEQWTIRGWPKGLAMFHKNNCQCCNK
jgi:hypothetical protein